MLTQNETPKIYVACLSSYNNGILHGVWIDCDVDADEIHSEIQEMLENSPEEDAEEWAIHDFEEWHGINIHEYESIEKVAELAEHLSKYGKPFALFYGYHSGNCTVDEFQDKYIGESENQEDFVRKQLEESGTLKRFTDTGLLESYIDFEAIARDWFISSYYSIEDEGKIYVFTI